MTTFGLVHGAFYGSWCWKDSTHELERLGHRVLTVDLPSEEPQAGAAPGPHLRSLPRGGADPLRITLLSGWTPELKVRTDLATRP
jgi:hypothetical protein